MAWFGRGRRAVAAVAVGLAALGSTLAAPAGAQTTCSILAPSTAAEAKVFQRVNSARTAQGIPALRWNSQLACLARDWSTQMSKSGVLRHRDLASTLRSSAFVGWKTLGENILVGPYYMTGDQMFSAWWASTAHRANILSRSFTAAGVGTVVAGTKVWATMNFGG